MPNPSKELFYKTVYKTLNKKKYKKTLDIGCGHFDLLKNISTKKYNGIDILDYKMDIGKNAYYKKIDFNKFQTQDKFDLIVIHNTINYNGYYDIKKFKKNFEKMNSLLSKDGYLSFNFGHRNQHGYNKINQFVLNNHNKYNLSIVKKFNYGLFHYVTNPYLYKLILGLILLFPILDRNHFNQKFKYFLLKKTKP